MRRSPHWRWSRRRAEGDDDDSDSAQRRAPAGPRSDDCSRRDERFGGGDDQGDDETGTEPCVRAPTFVLVGSTTDNGWNFQHQKGIDQVKEELPCAEVLVLEDHQADSDVVFRDSPRTAGTSSTGTTFGYMDHMKQVRPTSRTRSSSMRRGQAGREPGHVLGRLLLRRLSPRHGCGRRQATRHRRLRGVAFTPSGPVAVRPPAPSRSALVSDATSCGRCGSTRGSTRRPRPRRRRR